MKIKRSNQDNIQTVFKNKENFIQTVIGGLCQKDLIMMDSLVKIKIQIRIKAPMGINYKEKCKMAISHRYKKFYLVSGIYDQQERSRICRETNGTSKAEVHDFSLYDEIIAQVHKTSQVSTLKLLRYINTVMQLKIRVPVIVLY